MLEVKNLKKVYKTKNGVNVNALDGVSLQFPEKGMIFLLGKSGSGKSTLLNVCGGLDAPTSGEVIVKGRSSKHFSGSDFDSYRNTFIGFIFQEYNILNEFSVEDNIALALELQGKPKDKKAIQALLEEVDLVGFAKRKPNTLSGGQKQRIAIARALIKAPEIIMADEPTGALDSNTGKQVFDTLKKLSQKKLVIVVSHDRDFAEQYGDRIIELKDGKVLSDVTKTQVQQQSLSENVNSVGDILCIKRGADLNETDFEKIKSFLKKSENDVIIANNQTDVQNFKKVSRISDGGGKEIFADTDAGAITRKEYTKEESRFIRSKLPMKHAAKIGVSGLKNKPFRLTLTVFLCTVAFVMFGLLSTMNFYDSHSSFMQTMADVNPSVMQLERLYQYHEYWYEMGSLQGEYDSYSVGRFAADELRGLSAKFGAEVFGALDYQSYFNLRQNNSSYWIGAVSSYSVLPENHAFRQNINGKYPAAQDEILLTSYLADVLYNCNVNDVNGETMNLATPTDIIGKQISLNGFNYKVTGILDVGPISSKYDTLKEMNDPRFDLVSDYMAYLSDGLYQFVFVSQERLDYLASEYRDYESTRDQEYRVSVIAVKQDDSYDFPEYSNSWYMGIGQMAEDEVYVPVTAEKNELANHQVILPSGMFANYVSEAYYRMISDLEKDKYIDEGNEALLNSYYEITQLAAEIMQGGIYLPEEDKDYTFQPYSEEEYAQKLNTLIGKIRSDAFTLNFGLKAYSHELGSTIGDVYELEIAGVYLQEFGYKGGGYMTDIVVVSDSVAEQLWQVQKENLKYYSERQTNYKSPANAVFTRVLLPYVHSNESANEFWNVYRNEQFDENDTRLQLTGQFVMRLMMVDSMVKELSQVFLYVGLVFAVFAVLLFSNFISTSISQKKKEIGILRAVGARGLDVFKIFFSESFVIGAICVALSVAACIFLCGLINTELASGIGVSLLVFGLPSFAVLLGAAFVTVVVATFLPVYNAARKKPVDSIRAL